MDPRSTLLTGCVLAIMAILFNTIALGTKWWAYDSTEWQLTTIAGTSTLKYTFNWGLYKYDSSTTVTSYSGSTLYSYDRNNYEMDCSVLDDNDCTNLEDAQTTTIIALVSAVLALLFFTCSYFRKKINRLLIVACIVAAIVQVIMAINAVASYAEIVKNNSTVEITYTIYGVTYTYIYDVNIKEGYSWSLMLVSMLLAIAEVVAGAISLIKARKEPALATAVAEQLLA